MKLKIIIAFFSLLLISSAVFIALSQIKTQPFAPAADFPREALIYAQAADLPALIKLWDESKLNEKYTTSINYHEFQNSHLGLKLASRWNEFNAAAGFPIDLQTAAHLAENQAAIAVYDIGKLDFVFIAPISEELFAATNFFRNKDNFTPETLADGTPTYRATVAADRGRQRQHLIFTNVKGRFIVATSEQLLMQTINNINGDTAKNRLTDEPSFNLLSGKITPHAATVWVNQTALNTDYYFKHYWLMSDVKNLRNIRAGIFDFELWKDRLIENRRFLLSQNSVAAPISNVRKNEMLAWLPENIPFYKIQKADADQSDKIVRQTIFDDRTEANDADDKYSTRVYEGYTSGNYEGLGEKFDAMIDEKADEMTRRKSPKINLSTAVALAQPQAALTFTAPQILAAPRFAQFHRVAIFSFAAPQNFNQAAFESAIAQHLATQILVAAPDVELNWQSKSVAGKSWRELSLPMLGRTIAYALRGDELILTDDADTLNDILSNRKIQSAETTSQPFSELMLIDLDQRKNVYDGVFNELARQKEAQDFFAGNVFSLLEAISETKKIEIRKNFLSDGFEEELTFFLR